MAMASPATGHPAGVPDGIPERRTGIVLGHPGILVQLGFSELVQRMPGVELCASESTPERTAAAVDRYEPALLVLASEFRAVLKRIRRVPRVLLLSPHEHAGEEGSFAETCAFSSETDSIDSLTITLRGIADCAQPRTGAGMCARCSLRASVQPPDLPLSPRERAVFERIASGNPTRRIALRLGISIKTVETYRDNIKNKLALSNGAALTEAALLWRRGMRLPAPPR